MDFENIIMEIIVNSGDARSTALEAIKTARKGNLEKARQMLIECDTAMLRAHEIQTNLIQCELCGKPTEMTLLMVHAQDHLMNALTVKELAEQIVEMVA
ncbi:MAG: PTS lactose/cellobiose transporter subunit IIA [Firmicutes bacterium]|nr:PTS lactose/cellobiose transporter subunit IIA [Bacillota bacterium]